MKRALQIMGAVSAALFVALTVIAKTGLEPSGIAVFDAHFGGYSVAQARDYLSALSPEQTARYLGLFQTLDTFFPILLCATLMGIIWTGASGMGAFVRGAIALTPCVYLMLDLSENAAVAHLLNTGPQVSGGAILQASAFTVAKWISLTLAMLLCVWAWRMAPKDRPER